jgi:hypothetical protein
MGDIFGAAGSVASAAIQANAVENAAAIQAKALRDARDYVFTQLNPDIVGGHAVQGDVDRAKQRLALQAIIDPSLSALRYSTQGALAGQQAGIGQGNADAIAAQAASEALNPAANTADLRSRLINAAISELDAGATLPPDVQAEFVRAGLEKAGMVTGAASPKGIGGTLLRKEIGTRALALKQQRQQNAAALGATASTLESQRQALLASLFPNLQQQQLSNIGANQSILNQSNTMVPEAGLSGTDIANLWLARVGATNQLSTQAANAQAAGALGTAAAWGPAIGQAAQTLGNNAGNIYNTVSGWFSSPQARSGGALEDAIAYV